MQPYRREQGYYGYPHQRRPHSYGWGGRPPYGHGGGFASPVLGGFIGGLGGSLVAPLLFGGYGAQGGYGGYGAGYGAGGYGSYGGYGGGSSYPPPYAGGYPYYY
ncbi:hypothetical protein [Shouchella shacheensis]|uniref:hypothetical protein n=1 Tax=Shouchella shacheensis TaxID=1649580 RepID=UPI00073FFBC8|nr:hypothetical protein [Shouchella shacheensis]